MAWLWIRIDGRVTRDYGWGMEVMVILGVGGECSGSWGTGGIELGGWSIGHTGARTWHRHWPFFDQPPRTQRNPSEHNPPYLNPNPNPPPLVSRIRCTSVVHRSTHRSKKPPWPCGWFTWVRTSPCCFVSDNTLFARRGKTHRSIVWMRVRGDQRAWEGLGGGKV